MNMCLLEVAMCEKCRSSHFQPEGGLKDFRTGGGVTDLRGLLFAGGISTPLHAMKTMCEICSNLTVKKSERLNNIVLVSSLLTLERSHT